MTVMDELDQDLPDCLALPLATGEPWWYWLGGRPALDLVNTLRERWRRRVDTLVTHEDLSRWLVRAGITPQPLRVTRSLLESARELREAIDALAVAAVEGAPAPAAAIALVDDWLVYAGIRPQLVLGRDGEPLLSERAAG